MNSKNTKRALLTSVLAMVVCLAMLVGSTFAWFTDTATTGVNKIVSGTLAVDIVSKEGTSLQGKALNFVKEGDGDILWEPGCTYVTEPFKVVNKGNLALKYKLVINGLDGDSELLDVITFDVIDDFAKTGAEVKLDEFVGHIPANAADTDEQSYIMLRGKMDTAAGNKYQGKTLAGISITVVATQDTVERDSFDNMYDDEATYPEYTVKGADGLKEAFEKGGVVTIDNDIAVPPTVTEEEKAENKLIPQTYVKADTILDLSGKTLGVDAAAKEADFGKASPLLMSVDGAELTINGNGVIDCEAGENQVYGINVINGGKVVVNSGKFYGALTAIQVTKGSLEINGGFFDMAPTCKAQVPQYAKYVINCIDAGFKAGTATISIKGGTFVNFDPSDNPEGVGTTYVADGYKVVSETKDNGDVWYTVVAE